MGAVKELGSIRKKNYLDADDVIANLDDKLKIKTLEQQLAASKTLEWAKQSSASEGVSMGTETSSSESKRYSNPRLEQIRKAREAREVHEAAARELEA